jgi:hypothetical protein
MICIARAWVVLMKRLGYTQFVAQGDQHAWCCSTRRFKGDPSENEDKKKKRRSSRKGHLTTNKVIIANCFQVVKNG